MDRWLELSEPDQDALLELAEAVRLSENHFRDFFDWLEEIVLRDGGTIRQTLERATLSRILSDPRLGRNDKLKYLKEEVRRLRFPRLARMEQEIQERIRGLKLGPQIQMRVPPGLEGGALTVEVRATHFEELKGLVAELDRALERDSVKTIFALLCGEEKNAGL